MSINLSGMDFHKYIVIKQDDLYRYTSQEDQVDLARIIKTIRDGRGEEKKNTGNKYLVINVDVDYADEVVDILKKNNHWK